MTHKIKKVVDDTQNGVKGWIVTTNLHRKTSEDKRQYVRSLVDAIVETFCPNSTFDIQICGVKRPAFKSKKVAVEFVNSLNDFTHFAEDAAIECGKVLS